MVKKWWISINAKYLNRTYLVKLRKITTYRKKKDMAKQKIEYTEKITVCLKPEEKKTFEDFCQKQRIPTSVMIRKIALDKIDEETRE